jgi:hypothetical protein
VQCGNSPGEFRDALARALRVLSSRIVKRKRHAGWGGGPHQGDFIGGEAVGFVDQVAEAAFELQGFGDLGAGGFDRARVFVAQAFQGGG